jgi:hypothetical protein
MQAVVSCYPRQQDIPANANDAPIAPTESTRPRLPPLTVDVRDAVPVDGGFLVLRVGRQASQP